MSKTDPVLGQHVKQYLAKHNVESPIDYEKYGKLTAKEKEATITDLMTEILETLGFDLSNDSVEGTPRRVAKMWVSEVMSGLDYDKPRIVTGKQIGRAHV